MRPGLTPATAKNRSLVLRFFFAPSIPRYSMGSRTGQHDGKQAEMLSRSTRA
jgi:hypothetical protein